MRAAARPKRRLEPAKRRRERTSRDGVSAPAAQGDGSQDGFRSPTDTAVDAALAIDSGGSFRSADVAEMMLIKSTV